MKACNNPFQFPLLLVLSLMLCATLFADMDSDFQNPPRKYKSRPLWFWRGQVSNALIDKMIHESYDDGYYGFGILPSDGRGMDVAFLGPEYLKFYERAITQVQSKGMKLCLYDENWFPSGSANGQLFAQCPESRAQRLDKTEYAVTGPVESYTQSAPAGILMGCVAWNTANKSLTDISIYVRDGKLTWDIPAGPHKIMFFNCHFDDSSGRNLVNYLDKEAVDDYISLTYDVYYAHFGQYFGVDNVIDSAFYDEPTLTHVDGGRAWTYKFNDKFEAKHGYSPVKYYPALWYDIGKDTQAARCALYGFRADLFAEAWTKNIQDWCHAHGNIPLHGHQLVEERRNPTGSSADLMKVMRDQDIPTIDEIKVYGHSTVAYKIISSAAFNWDKPLNSTECYGATPNETESFLYKEVFDQFAKGVNFMIPHACWIVDDPKRAMPPILDYTDPYWGPLLPAYNNFVGRMHRILQGGRHVADIGVLYPIATLHGGYILRDGEARTSGGGTEDSNYQKLGEMLSLEVRRDFTYVHPEVLDQRCSVDAKKDVIRLNNKINYEDYKVFIIPGQKTISKTNIEKIVQFFDGGGKVICVEKLPEKSAEFGQDATIQAAVKHIFGTDTATNNAYTTHTNANGGMGIHLSKVTPSSLKVVLDKALSVYDVEFESDFTCTIKADGGHLSYIHKVKEGRDYYFFGNSSDTDIDTWVRIRGKFTPEKLNPHTGTITMLPASDFENSVENGKDVTRIHLKLGPVESVFYRPN